MSFLPTSSHAHCWCLSLAWADDTWLFNSTPHNADVTFSELESAAARETGLLIRSDMCTVMDMNPEAMRAESVADANPYTMVLHKITRADKGQCVKMLGATIQIGAEYRGEWIATSAGASGGYSEASESRRCARCT